MGSANISFGAMAALLTALPLYFLPSAHESFNLPKFILLQSVLLGTAAAAGVVQLRGRGFQCRETALSKPLLFLAGTALAAYLLSPCREAGADALGRDLAALGLPLLGLQAATDRQRYSRLAACALGAAAAFVFTALFFALRPEAELSKASWGMFNTIGHPGMAGIYLAAVLPFSLTLSFEARSPRGRWLAWTAGLLASSLLLLSGNRTGLLAAGLAVFACAGALAFGRTPSRFRPVLARTAGWLLGAALLVAALPLPGQKAFVAGRMAAWVQMLSSSRSDWAVSVPAPSAADSGRDATQGVSAIRMRSFMWSRAWEMFKERPLLGYGPGSYAYMNLERQAAFLADPANASWSDAWTHADNPHNDYLRVAAEWGTGGLLGLLWLAAAAALRFRDAWRAADGSGRSWLAAGGASLAVPAAAMAVWFPLSLPASLSLVALALAAPGATVPAGEIVLRLPHRVSGAGLRAAAACLAAAAAWMIYGRFERQASDVLVASGRLLAEQGRIAEARQALARSVGLSGSNGRAYHYLGNIELTLGRPAEALALFRAAERKLTDVNIPYNTGLALWSLGMRQQAEEAFLRAQRLMPQMPEALIRLAEVRAGDGDREGSRTWLRRLLELDAGLSADIQADMVRLDREFVDANLEATLRRNPRFVPILLALARDSLLRGDRTRAGKELARLAASPAWSLFSEEEAGGLLLQGAALDPRWPEHVRQAQTPGRDSGLGRALKRPD